jgi:N-acetylmuramoyl-L-alanine amidase
MRKITLLVVHCTATSITQQLTPQALDESHRRRGFSCCGYHYYILRNGQITPMRPVEQIGAHAKGYNANSIGIAYEGGLNPDGRPADTRTGAQRTALVSLLKQLHEHYPDARICGHRDLSPDLNGNGRIEPAEYVKACPCFNAAQEYAYITAHNANKPQPTPPNLAHFVRSGSDELPLPANQNNSRMKKVFTVIWKACKFIARFVPWLMSLRDNSSQR